MLCKLKLDSNLTAQSQYLSGDHVQLYAKMKIYCGLHENFTY